ncbi:hypothetical protein ACWDYH_35635 [Nocardia goodfellowii]
MTEQSITFDTRVAVPVEDETTLMADGLPLTVGYVWNAGNARPTPFILLAGDDCTTDSQLIPVPDGGLAVYIDRSTSRDQVCQRDSMQYVMVNAVLDRTGRAFTGEVFINCGEQSRDDPPMAWTGTARRSRCGWPTGHQMPTGESGDVVGDGGPSHRVSAVIPETMLESATWAHRADHLSPATGAGDTARESMGVIQLLAMRDNTVLTATSNLFNAQLKYSPAVRRPFFPYVSPPSTAAVEDRWLGEVAAGLAAWALSATSLYGFSRTIDARKARDYVEKRLSDKSQEFLKLARHNYVAEFPSKCARNGAAFEWYRKNNSAGWGAKLADQLTDEAYIVKEVLCMYMGDPGFSQRLHLNEYKVKLLKPGEERRVEHYWKEKTAGHPRGEWRFYENMESNRYSEQTFLADVEYAVNVRTVTRWGFVPTIPRGRPARVASEFIFGAAVQTWLNDNRRRYPFITEAAPDNLRKGVGIG